MLISYMETTTCQQIILFFSYSRPRLPYNYFADSESQSNSLFLKKKMKPFTYQPWPGQRLSRFIWVGSLSPDQSMFYQEQLEDVMDSNPFSPGPVNVIKLYQHLKYRKKKTRKSKPNVIILILYNAENC